MEIACVVVPRFLIALVRRDSPALAKRAVIIGQASEIRGNVLACSNEAAEAGVISGMPLTQAMVLCPAAAVVPLRQEEAEAADQDFTQILAENCPAVERIDLGHVHADIQGMAKLLRLTPIEYLAQLQEMVEHLTGLPVRVGGAATVFVAHAAAHFLANPACHVALSQANTALEHLPVEALPVSDAMLQRLHLFGLERLEQLGALPPTALQAQFGREGLLAWRLIHGEEAGRIVPARDELRVAERITLPAPAATSAPMILGTEIILQRALHRDEIDGRSVRHADWTAELENEERLSLHLVFREPTSDAKRILFILRNAIQRQALAAPAVGVQLTLSGICSEYVRQERLWRSGPRRQEALGEAVEQINARMGRGQLCRVVEVEPWSRIPERQRALAAFSP